MATGRWVVNPVFVIGWNGKFIFAKKPQEDEYQNWKEESNDQNDFLHTRTFNIKRRLKFTTLAFS
jgi:hypothetical protein